MTTHTTNDKAVVLVSGGLDSATTLAIAKSQGYACYALSFDYGQRHRVELQAARRVTDSIGIVEHKFIHLNLDSIGGSALTDSQIQVPTSGLSDQIPVTYVPARNSVFLTLALGWAEVLSAYHLFIGVNAIDYSGYPDCRPEFIAAFEQMANLATKAGVEGHHFKVHTPLIHLTKAQIIQEGLRLGVDYSLTISCYQPTPSGKACSVCDACRLRADGFQAYENSINTETKA
ncbi:MAG: 7-cyano-7-deazaguanine synthase QueC [Gammaproteobacteria bacterium]|nr:MAG: 7-cyano-7-deazaguanine synthase QueC [Gammaproteobacteria bacterium]RKZ44965.1 MAG: 7-cyano-7-deazaguanine synthase QueC [Gammaproteobacteria bacterium]RKZ73206.1 MAG: 7-cyano-7-deazaguanine synthase QueC [Gammaproteobacteria bacterium]